MSEGILANTFRLIFDSSTSGFNKFILRDYLFLTYLLSLLEIRFWGKKYLREP